MSQFGATAKNPPWVRTTGKFGEVNPQDDHVLYFSVSLVRCVVLIICVRSILF